MGKLYKQLPWSVCCEFHYLISYYKTVLGYDDNSSVDDPSSLESLNERQKIDLKVLDALAAVLLSANEDAVQSPLKTWAAKLLVIIWSDIQKIV